MEFRDSLVMNSNWEISDAALGHLFDSVYDLKQDLVSDNSETHAALILLAKNELDSSNNVLLSKILEAISIDLNNCKIVIYEENPVNLSDIPVLPQLVLCFGAIPNIDSAKYTIATLNSSSLICCDSLNEIRQNTDLKRALWSSLKQINL